MSITKQNGSNLPAVFTYGENEKVTALLIEDKPCFIAKEICIALKIKNSRQAITNLDDDEKLVYSLYTSGQKRNVNVVNESGLYNLIFRSNKPEAKTFRKWVTNEVLPALRKQGSYQIKKHNIISNINDNVIDARIAKAVEITPLINQAITKAGNRIKLARKIGVSTPTLYRVMNCFAEVCTEDTLQLIEVGCKRILNKDADKTDMEAVNMLMRIEDTRVRMVLFAKMKRGGLI